MRRDLRNRRVLLTGASSGIGQCLAEKLAAAGAKVALSARSVDRLNEMACHLSGHFSAEVVALPADITRAEDRQRLFDQVEQRWGGLDILINNAGIASWAHFAESDEGIIRQVMEVNF